MGAFYEGLHWIMTGFGPAFGQGVFAGMLLMAALMYFGGNWTDEEIMKRREQRRRGSATALPPISPPVVIGRDGVDQDVSRLRGAPGERG